MLMIHVLGNGNGICAWGMGYGEWGVVRVLTYLLIGVVHGSGEEIGKGARRSCSIKLLTLHPGTPQAGKVGYQLPIG